MLGLGLGLGLGLTVTTLVVAWPANARKEEVSGEYTE